MLHPRREPKHLSYWHRSESVLNELAARLAHSSVLRSHQCSGGTTVLTAVRFVC
jgi:hypothetical protein